MQSFLMNANGNTLDSAKYSKRKALFGRIVTEEDEFVEELGKYLTLVVNPLLRRDTSFKRDFLTEPSIAVTFNLLQDIFTASSHFLENVRSAVSRDNFSDILTAYNHFAPSLSLFGQFAGENATCLNTLKNNSKKLAKFVSAVPFPDGMNLQSTLVVPVEHYSEYSTGLKECLALTPLTDPQRVALLSTVEAIDSCTAHVDAKLDEAKDSILLVALQSQCQSVSLQPSQSSVITSHVFSSSSILFSIRILCSFWPTANLFVEPKIGDGGRSQCSPWAPIWSGKR